MEDQTPLHDLPPDEPRRASITIADALIADIRAGAFTQGAPLPTERALCERFAASRPTIREALAQLQMRGFVTAGAGRRPRVAQPDLAHILAGAGERMRDILDAGDIAGHLEQMRQFIETGAAREAARRSDTAQMARLADCLQRNGAAVGRPDFADTDIAFHRALVSILGNPVILTLHDLFVSRLLAGRAPHDDPEALDRIAHAEHRAIFEAILARDQLGAASVMEEHLDRSWRARLLGAPARSMP